MLSRVAESIYWLNRFVERADNVARFVDVNLNLMLDSHTGIGQQWEPLVVTTGDLPLFQQRYAEATAENVIAVPIRVRYAKTFDSQLLQPLCMYLI